MFLGIASSNTIIYKKKALFSNPKHTGRAEDPEIYGGKMNLAKKLVCVLLVLTVCFLISCSPRDKLFPSGPQEYQIEPNRQDLTPVELKLANRIYPADTQLSSLMRRLEGQDAYPDQAWKQQLLQDFPWLSGIAVLDRQGDILSRQPEIAEKELEFSPLFPESLELRRGRIMLEIEDSPLGPEILLTTGIHQDYDLERLVVAHFDPSSFIAQAEESQEIILTGTDQVLWTGGRQELENKLEELDWKGMTDDRVSGRIQLDGEEYFWFARAVNQDWLIYLVQDE